MSNHVTDACTTYLTCALAMGTQVKGLDIDWATLGAVILLVARLIKDVPDAIVVVVKWIKRHKRRKKKKKNE